MKAVFIHERVILRDSHIDPHSPVETWQLMPATQEAIRMLGRDGALVFVYTSRADGEAGTSARLDEEGHDHALDALVRQVEAGGGRVDGIITCPHATSASCRCWGDSPAVFLVPAFQFGFKLDECYVLAESQRDVMTAYAAGALPILVLCGRTVGQVLGNGPERKDYPIATDLTTAVSYIAVEEEIAQELGHPRQAAPATPAEDILFGEPAALPYLAITSAQAESIRARALKTRAQLRDTIRWLTFFVLGGVGVSLGIAYLLTHLYRVTPFPAFVGTLTLQFIPRPLRGALFIAIGVGVVALAVRSFVRSTKVWWRGRPL